MMNEGAGITPRHACRNVNGPLHSPGALLGRKLTFLMNIRYRGIAKGYLRVRHFLFFTLCYIEISISITVITVFWRCLPSLRFASRLNEPIETKNAHVCFQKIEKL